MLSGQVKPLAPSIIINSGRHGPGGKGRRLLLAHLDLSSLSIGGRLKRVVAPSARAGGGDWIGACGDGE